MNGKLSIHSLIVIVILFVIGCSHQSTPVTTSDYSFQDKEYAPIIVGTDLTPPDHRGIMGVFELRVDGKSRELELIPKRFANIGESYIVSGISYFTMVPCPDCLTLTGLSYDPLEGYLYAHFNLRHPFPKGDPAQDPTAMNRLDLDIFDPALVFVPEYDENFDTNNFNEIGAQVWDRNCVVADGLTAELSSMLDNDLLLPYVLAVDDSITGEITYNKLGMGTNTDFSVMFDLTSETFHFDLYLTFGYGASAVKSTRLEPLYYNPEFNRKSAWKVGVQPPNGIDEPDIWNTWNEMEYDVPFEVTVSVYDWQINADINPDLLLPTQIYAASGVARVDMEIPGLFDGAFSTTEPYAGTGKPVDPLLYTFSITNDNLSEAGTYPGLVKVVDERGKQIPPPSGTGDRDYLIDSPDGITLNNWEIPEYATYQFFEIQIVEGVPGVVLFQADIIHDDVEIPNSDYGYARVSYTGILPPQFFNLSVNGVRVLRNIPLLTPDGEDGLVQSQIIAFNLGAPVGTDVTTVTSAWTTAFAPTDVQPSPEFSTPVHDKTFANYDCGGNPGAANNQGGNAVDKQIEKEAKLPPVDQGGGHFTGVAPSNTCYKGCVVGAVHSSLLYLQDKHGTPSKDKDITWAGVRAATAYDSNNGCPTNPANDADPGNWWNKKDSYADSHDYGIDTENRPASAIDQVMDDVDAGHDVEIRAWGGTSGHCAMVTGITKHDDGSYSIEVIHDIRQDSQWGDKHIDGATRETITYTPGQPIVGGHQFNTDSLTGFIVEKPES